MDDTGKLEKLPFFRTIAVIEVSVLLVLTGTSFASFLKNCKSKIVKNLNVEN